MRGAVSIIWMKRDGEYQVPIFNIDQPDPDAVAKREERIAQLKAEMGPKYMLHPEYVKPANDSGRLL